MGLRLPETTLESEPVRKGADRIRAKTVGTGVGRTWTETSLSLSFLVCEMGRCTPPHKAA